MGTSDRSAARAAANGHTKLHLGCGMIAPPTWLNVDGSWNARLQQHPRALKALGAVGVLPKRFVDMPWAQNVFIHNLSKPLPWDDGQFEAVYASHLLEHLTWGDARSLLLEARRVLAPGGVCRIVVPDLAYLIGEYEARDVEPNPGFFPADAAISNADAFVLNMGFKSPLPRPGGLPMRIYETLFDFHHHKWLYDEESLATQMSAAGFVDVGRREFDDSRISNIQDVELEMRVANGGLCCEGVVPA
jgi:SAM-dependent methyltransferase